MNMNISRVILLTLVVLAVFSYAIGAQQPTKTPGTAPSAQASLPQVDATSKTALNDLKQKRIQLAQQMQALNLQWQQTETTALAKAGLDPEKYQVNPSTLEFQVSLIFPFGNQRRPLPSAPTKN
jgi:hypothetical protein